MPAGDGLVTRSGTWHDTPMPNKRTPMAGGFAVMICTVAGALWGISHGWGSAGMVYGLGAGLAIAAVVWVVDRAR